MTGEDGALDPEPFISTADMRSILDAVESSAEALRAEQMAAFKVSGDDAQAEVLFGMASRAFRIFCEFLERPSSWAPATSGLFLRQIVDVQIVSAWLIRRDDPAMFAAYREHGLGRLKLLQAHLVEDFGEDPDEEVRVFLDALDARVNLERDAWFQPVNLADFAKVSMREMAIEADLKREYDLGYAPLSSDNHGEWPSVRDNDTQICTEPLHGNHRVGAFRRPSHFLSPRIVSAVFESAKSTICGIFESFQIDVTETLSELETAIEATFYAPPGEDDTGDDAT